MKVISTIQIGTLFWLLAGILLVSPSLAQPFIELNDCGLSYIDPQDEIDNGQNRDTLFYEMLFSEENQIHDYWIDVNAFGGQQVDRTEVFAILADGSLKSLGQLAFGNCVDCIDGFTLVHNGEVIVSEVSDVNTMNLWIQSLGQPPFTLTGNLQTLTGVGRISGQVPFCAIGMRVEYSVYSDPGNSSTQFSTHILCPQPVQECTFEPYVNVNCLANAISVEANLPDACFAEDATVSWFNNNGILSEEANALIPLTGNEGMLHLTIADDCCIYQDSFPVANPDFAEAGPDLIACQGAAYEITGSGGQDHFWELPNGNSNMDSVLNLPVVTASVQGEYILHAFNEEGCEDTDSIYITVESPPSPEIDFTEACLGDTLFLLILNDTAFAETQWTDPQGIVIADGYIPDFQPADAGTYSLTGTTISGCQIINTIGVTAKALPQLDYIIQESCDSAVIYLISDTLAYEWNEGTMGPILSTSTGGTFQVTVTDSDGCQSAETIFIPEPDGPEVYFEVDQPLCPGEYGQIIIELHSDEREAIFSIDGGQTFELSNRFDELLPGVYDVVIMDGLGCIQHFFHEIIAPDTMGVALPYEPITVRPNTPISLTATTVGEITTYQWVPDEIDTGLPATDFIANQDIDIRIIVEDQNGCKASASLPLTVELGDVYVPDAISPNGDGRNDGFTFYSDNNSGEILEVLRVFDRWGGMVFEAEGIPLNDEASGWDGTCSGDFLTTGVFTYYGIVRFGNGVRRLFEGDVQLIR